MKNFALTTMGVIGMIIFVWFIVSYVSNITRPAPVLNQVPEVEKYCTVETAQYGESLIVESEKYGGDINVLVTPSGGVYVTAPCVD